MSVKLVMTVFFSQMVKGHLHYDILMSSRNTSLAIIQHNKFEKERLRLHIRSETELLTLSLGSQL